MVYSRLFASTAVAALMLSFGLVGVASALTAICSGAPTATNITWTAAATSGVAPFAFLWGNGSTSTSQTIAAAPGTHTMTLQATDASSTDATTTCSATVTQSAPTITSFTATPSSITAGQNSLLSWVVANASSTSINNGIGTVTGTSVTVSPSATTIYTLSAVNPGGTTTANATVTVSGTTTPPTGIAAQIQALLAQIKALQAQIFQLIAQQAGGGSGGTATSTPQSCFRFWRHLKHGDFGDDVKELQQQLAHDNPTLFPPGLITGFFGPKTEAALKMFQRRFGIDVEGTGFFGMKSRAFFASQCSNGDADNDGAVNSADSDDDNDGTPDLSDRFPFNPNATSTPVKWNNSDRGNNGRNGNDNRGRGHSNNNNDDDDDDDDDDD